MPESSIFVTEKGASGPLFNLNSVINLLARKLFNIMGLLKVSFICLFFILLISIPGFSYAEEMEKVNKNALQTTKRNKIVVQNQLEMNKTDKKGTECQPIYGNYWRSSKWGWYGARRVVKTPLEAKEILDQFLLHNREIRVVKIIDKPHFFVGEIINSRGAIIDLILIDKRTGRIRSMF